MENRTWLFVFSLVSLLLFVPASPVALYFSVQEMRSGERTSLLVASLVLSILGTALLAFFLLVLLVIFLTG